MECKCHGILSQLVIEAKKQPKTRLIEHPFSNRTWENSFAAKNILSSGIKTSITRMVKTKLLLTV